MSDIILDAGPDFVSVVAPPESVRVSYEIGQTGQRGSMWFTGSGLPGPTTIPDVDLNINDMYMDNSTGNVYQYILLPSNVGDWSRVGTVVGGSVWSVAGRTGDVVLSSADLTDAASLATDAELTAGLATKADEGHTHPVSEISDSTATGRSVLTAADAAAARTAIGAAPALGADDNYVTDAEKTKLANLSGVNTGDQDLSGYVQTTNAPELIRDTIGSTLVAGSNVTITPNDANDTITIAVPGIGLAKNLVVNGDFSNGLTGWSPWSSTLSVSNNILSAVGNGNGNGIVIAFQRIPPVPEARFYVASRVRTLETASGIGTSFGGSYASLQRSPVAGQWYQASVILTPSSSAGNLDIYANFSSGAESAGKTLQLQNALCVNLTAAFGAGNEPSQTEMDYLLAKYPNSWFDGTVYDLVSRFDPKERFGTGMPNGVITAAPGSYYTDTAGTNGAWRWLKKSGTGDTGWDVVHGDTGWRKIAGWTSGVLDYGTMPTGLAPKAGATGGVYIRRNGSSVTGAVVGGTAAAVLVVIQLASGFKGDNSIIPHHTGSESGRSHVTSQWFLPVNTGAKLPNWADPLAKLTVSFNTADPWPTTLPGTPA